jgi:hypothetical protein
VANFNDIATVSYCAISGGKIIHDNNLVFESKSNTFLKEAYENLLMDYPKFFKMDDLSKLCFLTAEYLLQNIDLSEINPEEKAIVVHNRNSSIISDRKFLQSCHDIPSPAHFVYTLPNVMIGEVCIKNKIKGENHCFISETYEHEFQFELIKNLLLNGNKVCIHGWVDFSENGYSSLLFLSKLRSSNQNALSQETINKIIQDYARAY